MRMTKALAATVAAVNEIAKELGLLAPTDDFQIVPAGDARVAGIWSSIITEDGQRIAPPFLIVGFDGTRSYVGATLRQADDVLTAVYWTMHAIKHRRFR